MANNKTINVNMTATDTMFCSCCFLYNRHMKSSRLADKEKINMIEKKKIINAIRALEEESYIESIVRDLQQFESSDIGYRLGGTPAEAKASAYLADKLIDLGLDDVHLEEIPVDAFEFKGAKVLYDEKTVIASQIAGYGGTGPNGICAEICYVGEGTKAEYDAVSTDPEFFKGKIVLVDDTLDVYWFSWVAAEALCRKVAGVIMTHRSIPPHEKGTVAFMPDQVSGYCTYADDMILGNAGQSPDEKLPLVFISAEDGEALKNAINRSGSGFRIKLISEANVKMAENGGKGFNVFGRIQGTDPEAGTIMMAAHQDAHLRAAADDTAAVATLLGTLKLMKTVGFKPKQSIQVVFTSSEEFGRVGTMYDWQHGMYCAVKMHPEWAGEINAFYNYEAMPEKNAGLMIQSPVEWVRFLNEQMKLIEEEGIYNSPQGYQAFNYMMTNSDDWSANAAGIPGFCMMAISEDYLTRYHSNYDSIENLDFKLAAEISATVMRMIENMEGKVLPYDLVSRANEIRNILVEKDYSISTLGWAKDFSCDALINAGADECMVNKVIGEADKLLAEIEIKMINLKADERLDVNETNRMLRKILSEILKCTCALDIMPNAIYPYVQMLSNTAALKRMTIEFDKECPDRDKLLEGAYETNECIYNTLSLSRGAARISRPAWESMKKLYTSKETDWGSLGKVSPVIDLYDVIEQLNSSRELDIPALKREVEIKYQESLSKLNERLKLYGEKLEKINKMVETL